MKNVPRWVAPLALVATLAACGGGGGTPTVSTLAAKIGGLCPASLSSGGPRAGVVEWYSCQVGSGPLDSIDIFTFRSNNDRDAFVTATTKVTNIAQPGLHNAALEGNRWYVLGQGTNNAADITAVQAHIGGTLIP